MKAASSEIIQGWEQRPTLAGRRIRVLVVDDSATARLMISTALKRRPEIDVVGTAGDAYAAREKILELNPDVLTLDLEMPNMDGLKFLEYLRQHRPMPVLVVSSLTTAGSRAALAALEAGAVDVLGKPASGSAALAFGAELARRILTAAEARRPQRAVSAPMAPPAVEPRRYHPRALILLGASTGGTEALKAVMRQWPGGLPGICIVQHIQPYFSKTFAERLDELCAFRVREAADGDEVRSGAALIAPHDFHMRVRWQGDRYRIRLEQDPPMHHARPAVDALFDSAAEAAGPFAVAALLTGMGKDGAAGMKKLKSAGATTFAQNEESCVVYGMPRAAVELGGVDRELPLPEMARAILEALRSRSRN